MILAGIVMILWIAWRLVGAVVSPGGFHALQLHWSETERFNLIALASLLVPIMALMPIELWLGTRLWARGDRGRLRVLMRRILLASAVLSLFVVIVASSPLLNEIRSLWVIVGAPIFVYTGATFFAARHAELRGDRSWIAFTPRFVGLELGFLGVLVAYIVTGVRDAALMLCR